MGPGAALGCGNQATLPKTAEHQLLLRCHPLAGRTTAGKKNVVEAVSAALNLPGPCFHPEGVAVLAAVGIWDSP